MKSIESLKKLYITAKNLPQKEFLSSASKQEIQNVNERMENLFAVPILNFLFEGDYKKLVELEKRFNQNTPIYNLTKFAGCLCADETDFEFLTNPENLENYVKLKKIAEKFQKEIPHYVNILQKICDNKSLGLYQEFQEIYFFFEEVEKSSSRNFIFAFENYKRILKLQTQKIFQEFISIDLFERASEILLKYENKIGDENVLDFYIFGELFFNLSLSNENENILLRHIDFCVRYLSKTKFIEFKRIETKKYFLQYGDLKERLKLFFKNENFDNIDRLPPLLKDYSLNNTEIVLFCNELRKILLGEAIFLTFTPAVNILEESISSLALDDDGIIFLQSLFKVAHNGQVSLREIKMYRYSEVLEYVIKAHFFTVKESERKVKIDEILNQNKKMLGEYFDAVKFLVEKNIFEKIIFTYHNEKQIGRNDYDYVLRNANVIADNYSKFSDREKLIDIISALYLIVIEKMNLHFEVGSRVHRAPDGYGNVIQIIKENFKNEEKIYYRIIWDSSEKLSKIPIDDAVDIELA